MRQVQLRVPDDRLEDVLAVLRDYELGYAVTAGADEHADASLVSFVTPADAVEHVLEDLTTAGYDRDRFTVSVSTEFASFAGVDDVQDEWAKSPNRIAPATLRSKAKDLRLNTRSYLWMMTLATVVATAGLFLASPAVVVGSMVLAPIVSPMLTASVGAVRDDREMLVDSVHMQGIGLGLAVLGAFLFSLLVKHAFAVPTTLDVAAMELISIRYSPGLLSVVVGFAAGAAGAFGLATKGQVSIVGVMVAAALIPTAAAAGIGFAWGEPIVGAGALVLLVVTMVAVNLGGYLMLKYLGYRPDEVDEGLLTVDAPRQAGILLATALVALALAVAVVAGTAQQVAFDHAVNGAVTDVLDEDPYEGLDVTAISTQYSGAGPLSDPVAVTVTLSRESDRSYAGLPNALDREISGRTDANVSVAVEYRDFDRSNVSASATTSRRGPRVDSRLSRA